MEKQWLMKKKRRCATLVAVVRLVAPVQASLKHPLSGATQPKVVLWHTVFSIY